MATDFSLFICFFIFVSSISDNFSMLHARTTGNSMQNYTTQLRNY